MSSVKVIYAQCLTIFFFTYLNITKKWESRNTGKNSISYPKAVVLTLIIINLPVIIFFKIQNNLPGSHLAVGNHPVVGSLAVGDNHHQLGGNHHLGNS